MERIAVIDYDAGNTLSVVKALEYLGMSVDLTRDKNHLLGCERIIFPGVGAYFDAMKKLEEYNLLDVIREAVTKGTPFLGICLGMQLLFDSSEETIGANDNASSVEGLKLLPGNIIKFRDIAPLKIPHMGWNSINIEKKDSKLLKNLPDNPYVYFVHSYYLKAADTEDVAATASYGINFDCAVERNNIFGCQFHPEKSGDTGLQILKNFCAI